MRLPDFFLIGAPKAGTTALYDAIGQHPDIFVSPVKEPYYFAFAGRPPVFAGPAGDRFHRKAVCTPQDYAALFTNVKGQRAVGEASVIYLQSPLAARRIRANLPLSRLVAVLRQPAERAYSHYNFARQVGHDFAPTFAEALRQEDRRLRDGWFPGRLYQRSGRYHAQLAVYFDLFPRDQMRVYLYEDWRERPRETLRDLFGFLGVEEDFAPRVGRWKVARIPRKARFHRWAVGGVDIPHWTRHLPSLVRGGVMNALQRLNARFNMVTPPPLDPAIRASITNDLREDILRLQDLIHRDLSLWLQT